MLGLRVWCLLVDSRFNSIYRLRIISVILWYENKLYQFFIIIISHNLLHKMIIWIDCTWKSSVKIDQNFSIRKSRFLLENPNYPQYFLHFRIKTQLLPFANTKYINLIVSNICSLNSTCHQARHQQSSEASMAHLRHHILVASRDRGPMGSAGFPPVDGIRRVGSPNFDDGGRRFALLWSASPVRRASQTTDNIRSVRSPNATSGMCDGISTCSLDSFIQIKNAN